MTPFSAHCAAILGCSLLFSISALSVVAPAAAAKTRGAGGKILVYVGGYTKGKTKGIFIYSMNTQTGELTPAGVGPDVESPSYLAVSPNHRCLYAVNEVDSFEGAPGGGVSSYKINPSNGALSFINSQTSGGTGPCHIAVDHQGKNVVVANYGSGSAEVLPIRPDGSLGKPTDFSQHRGASVDVSRQEGPHAHCATIDPAGKYVLINDLGMDEIIVYRFDSTNGKIDPNGLMPGVVAPGSGPRHFAFALDGKHGFCINEMKSTITAFKYDPAAGSLTEYQTVSTLPPGFTGSNTCAELVVSPDGKFVYGSNRGADSIAIYSISPKDDRLTLVGFQSTQGKTPRCFNIDPSGNFLLAANQDSNSLVVFRRDRQTGKLTPTGQTLETPSPVCIVFLK